MLVRMSHESACGGLRPRSDFGMRNADFGMQLTQVLNLRPKIKNPKSEIPKRSRNGIHLKKSWWHSKKQVAAPRFLRSTIGFFSADIRRQLRVFTWATCPGKSAMPFRHERRYHREAIGVFASAVRGGKYLLPSASVERSGRLIEYSGIND